MWISDLRSRQLRGLAPFAEAVRDIAVSYDAVLVPGALLLLVSGSWLFVTCCGGWSFLQISWLAGMAGLFAFAFIVGHTVTRRDFLRLRRITQAALEAGHVTAELEHARGETVPTFTHFLDLPMLFLIIALGTIQPTDRRLFLDGSGLAIALATAGGIVIRQLYRWGRDQGRR